MTTVWMSKPQDRVSEFANPYMTKENKEIKNSVLLDLFCEHETARQNEIALYNALHDVKLPDDTVVDKVRVNNTVYLNFKNDIPLIPNEISFLKFRYTVWNQRKGDCPVRTSVYNQ